MVFSLCQHTTNTLTDSLSTASDTGSPSYVPSIPLIPKTHTPRHGLLAYDSPLSVSDSAANLTPRVPSGPTSVSAGFAGPSVVIELPISPTTCPVVPLVEESPVVPAPPAKPIPTAKKLPIPHSLQTTAKSGIFKPKSFATALMSPPSDLVHIEPTSVQQALLSPYWKKAMEEEYAALMRNNTWSLQPLPAGRTPIGSKWVFRIKKNPDGSI